MARKYKILGIIVISLAVLIVSAALVLSHNSACPPARSVPSGEHMKAIVYRCYGPPEVLALEEIAKPQVAADQVLVRVRAAAANPLDWHRMRGSPYIMRRDAGLGAPNEVRFGVDYAGTVEAVGPDVKAF